MNKVTVTHDTSGEKLEVPIEFVFIPAPSGFRYRLTPQFFIIERFFSIERFKFPFGYDGPNNVGDVKPFYLAKYLHHDANGFPSVFGALQAQELALSIGGRLPSEYEWEWAAYGGEDWEYAGCTDVSKVAWTDQKCKEVQKVGQLKPNGYGLYDMSGLMWEWTSTAVDAKSTITDGGSFRVLRGGGWNFDARFARVACRVTREFRLPPSPRHYDALGFRVAMDVESMNEAIQSGRAKVIR